MCFGAAFYRRLVERQHCYARGRFVMISGFIDLACHYRFVSKLTVNRETEKGGDRDRGWEAVVPRVWYIQDKNRSRENAAAGEEKRVSFI